MTRPQTQSQRPPTCVDDLPAELPVFPLTGVVLLPRGHLPLHVFEPRYLAMIDAALAGGRAIAIAQPRVYGAIGCSVDDDASLQAVGCCGRIISFREARDGRLHIGLRGVCRLHLADELPMAGPFRRVRANYTDFADDLAEPPEHAVDRGRLMAALAAYAKAAAIDADWDALDETSDDELVTTVAMACPFAPEDKQALLESPTLAHRAKLVTGLIEAAAHRQPPSPTHH